MVTLVLPTAKQLTLMRSSSMVDQALNNASFVKVESHENILPNSDHLKTDDKLLCPQEQVSIEQKIRNGA